MAYQFGDITKGLYSGLKNIWNDITGYSTEVQNTNAVNQNNKEIAADTNKQNYDVAMQNLGFQRDLQEYNKALQQQMFEREDTSYQRTAKDMIAAGLNPLSMQGTNGAGEAISISPMQNNYQAQGYTAEKAQMPVMTGNEILNSMSSMITGLDQIKTAKLQRDALQLENDKKAIENYLIANRAGIKDYSQKKWKYLSGQDISSTGNFDWDSEKYENEKMKRYYDTWNTEREFKHKVETGKYDTDTDFERMFTSIMDWAVNGRSEEALNKLRNKYPLIDSAIKFFSKEK